MSDPHRDAKLLFYAMTSGHRWEDVWLMERAYWKALAMKGARRMAEKKFIAWLASNKGPAPQLWYGDQHKGTGQFQRGPVGTGDLLGFHFIKEEDQDKTLDELRAMPQYASQLQEIPVAQG